jgi:hypothetical protein
MSRRFLLSGIIAIATIGGYMGINAALQIREYLQINCNGTAIVRTDVGTVETVVIAKNTSGCIGATDPIAMQTSRPVYAQVNCNGVAVARTAVGQLETVYVQKNLPGCIGPVDPVAMQETSPSTGATTSGVTTTLSDSHSPETWWEVPTTTGVLASYDPAQAPLLDITSEDIGNYRIEKLKEQGVQYANPVYSVRIRRGASMKTNTEAYLIKNDAVVVDGTGTTWAKVQGAEVVVTDTQENTVVAQTGSQARGYTVRRWLRDPNPSDLVRIGQADQAYWSDIAHVNVAHTVNVREHPWYGSKILFVVTNKTPLYIVSTVDNWSEVMNDDRTLRGYIRSDFLVVDKAQRREPEPLLK